MVAADLLAPVCAVCVVRTLENCWEFCFSNQKALSWSPWMSSTFLYMQGTSRPGLGSGFCPLETCELVLDQAIADTRMISAMSVSC